MSMARGKTGPFRVEPEVVSAVGGVVAVEVLLHDKDNGDRPITSASHVCASHL